MDVAGVEKAGMRRQSGGSRSPSSARPRNVNDAGSSRDSLDRRAIAAAKRGEWDAIHYLYVRYADDVFGYVQSIVRDHHEAEDITQNVFAKLITAIERYEERAVPFAGWIMRVARNATLDHLRARRQIPVEEVRTADPCDERARVRTAPVSQGGPRRPAGRATKRAHAAPCAWPLPTRDRRTAGKDRELGAWAAPSRTRQAQGGVDRGRRHTCHAREALAPDALAPLAG